MMRRLLSLTLALAATTLSVEASAFGGGAANYSGKQGNICSQANCHTGGAAPTVAFTGPESMKAGESADFTFEVTTALAKGSAGIAASDGAKLAATTNLQLSGAELTHTAGGTAPTGGKVTFSFKVTAPTSGTKMTIFAAGLGSDGTGPAGDGAAKATKDVTITGGAPATDPPAGSSGTSGGTSGSASKDKDKDKAPADDRLSENPFAAADSQAQCGLAHGSTGATGGLLLVIALMLAVRGSSSRRPASCRR